MSSHQPTHPNALRTTKKLLKQVLKPAEIETLLTAVDKVIELKVEIDNVDFGLRRESL